MPRCRTAVLVRAPLSRRAAEDVYKRQKTLSIDIETYSDIPLQKTGVYRYCESPNFEILLFGYSIDSGPVQVVDLACGEHIPKEVLDVYKRQALRSTPVCTVAPASRFTHSTAPAIAASPAA